MEVYLQEVKKIHIPRVNIKCSSSSNTKKPSEPPRDYEISNKNKNMLSLIEEMEITRLQLQDKL